MSNIETAIVEILNSEELFEKLCEAKTLEDAYNFCISVHGGYTLQEFEEFLENIDVPEFEKIDKDINLDKISGGKSKSNYSKILAFSLSMITLTAPIASATQVVAEEGKAQPLATSKKNTKKVSFWQKYKRYFIHAGIVGGAIAGLVLLYVINGKLISPGPDKSDKNENVDLEAQTSDKEGKGVKSQNLYGRAKSWVNDHFFPRWGPLSMGSEMLEDMGVFSKRVAQIGGASWIVKRAWNKFQEYKKRLDKKIDHEEFDYKNAQKNLGELLKTIAGQERAKRQIKDIVSKIVNRRNQAKLSGVKYAHGDVLYFAGPSGVGKTLMAEGLAKYKILSNTTDVFTISASEVDRESPESVVEQLFGMNRNSYSSWGGGFGMRSMEGGVVSEPKNLVKYLNQNRDGVVIINEYDKMWSRSLDEVFRTIIDNGVVNVKGQKIDCSGITFVLTSNEDSASLGLKEDPKQKNNPSRTHINHDKSFLNRLHPVEFEDLSVENYVKIIDKEIRNDVVNYWARPDVAGMNIVIDDECLKSMAVVVRRKKQGARYIDALAGELFSIATDKLNYKVNETGKEDCYKGQKVYALYDPDAEEFTLLDEDEKKEDDLKLEKYRKIIDKEILKDFVPKLSQRKEGSMDMVIDAESLENMAKVVKRRDKNSKYVNELKKQLLSKAIEKIEAKDKMGEKDYYKGKKVHVNYDLYKGKIKLVGEDEKE